MLVPVNDTVHCARAVAQAGDGVDQWRRHELVILHAHFHSGERAPCVLHGGSREA
jgi:hypothetical protein